MLICGHSSNLPCNLLSLSFFFFFLFFLMLTEVPAWCWGNSVYLISCFHLPLCLHLFTDSLCLPAALLSSPHLVSNFLRLFWPLLSSCCTEHFACLPSFISHSFLEMFTIIISLPQWRRVKLIGVEWLAQREAAGKFYGWQPNLGCTQNLRSSWCTACAARIVLLTHHGPRWHCRSYCQFTK